LRSAFSGVATRRSVAALFEGKLVIMVIIVKMIEFFQTLSYIPHEAMTLSNQHFLSNHHTKAIIIPVDALPSKSPNSCYLPLFMGKVSAGFPSPADDYIEKTLDLNELLVQKPAATFFARAQGNSMTGAGIFPNDILVVDRSIEPVSGKVVICAVDGELTVKRLIMEAEQWKLRAENTDYPDIMIYEEIDMVIWGVVTNVIHSL
jgi:DNA polymerase V